MGAIDLVVQIEAPPSVASGLQRIGRAGHQVGAVSAGHHLPEVPRRPRRLRRGRRGACTRARVEATRYPRNPLDVLAQQIVAMVAMDDVARRRAVRARPPRRAVRRAEPRASFEGVLDMLSGRYPSDEFAELRPRLTWDRVGGHGRRAREGAKRVAITNGGTIPDRGLYGVFLVGARAPDAARVGELDEEMVFESRVGETFLLGASSWRIEEITHDRVLVVARARAAGQDAVLERRQAGRGRSSSAARSARSCASLAAHAARDGRSSACESEHDLDRARRARTCCSTSRDQAAATRRACPTIARSSIERCRDELGDWRVCVLSPFGGRIHAPWAMAVAAELSDEPGVDVESDVDRRRVRGAVSRDATSRPTRAASCRAADEVEALRRAAARRHVAVRGAVPRERRPRAAPAAAAARAAHAALAAAQARRGPARGRLALRLVPDAARDLPRVPARRLRHAGLVDTARGRSQAATIRVVTVDSRTPSPFAASLLFGYVAQLHLRRRRAAGRAPRAGALDRSAQLRELLGDAELRELLDADAHRRVERSCSTSTGDRPAKHADGLHDLLLSLGDLTEAEIERALRAPPTPRRGSIAELAARPRDLRVNDRRRATLRRGRGRRPLPRRARRDAAARPPAALLEPVADPLGDLVSRYARTHGPFLHRRRAPRASASASRRCAPRSSASPRAAACSRASSARADARPSGATPRCCARSSAARSRAAQGGRAGRARGARALPARLARSPSPARAAPTRCSPWSSSCRARRSPPRSSRPTSSRRASRAIAPAISISSAPRARSCGSASSRSARATAASRSTSPISCRSSRPRAQPAEGELAAQIRAALRAARRALLRRSRRRDRRVPGRVLDALWDLGLGGRGHQRHARAAAQLPPRRARRAQAKRRRRAVAPSARARVGPPGSEGRWSLLSRRAARKLATETRAPRRARARAARAPRRAHPRGGPRRGDRRRLLRGLRGAEGDGGVRAASAAATSSRASARRSSRCRGADDRLRAAREPAANPARTPRRHRSRQPLRRRARLAGA